MARAEKLGLYKPQSGNFGAELGEGEQAVFGVSQLEKIREENIRSSEEAKEKLETDIELIKSRERERLEKMEADADSETQQGGKSLSADAQTALIAKNKGDFDIEAARAELDRPLNTVEKWTLKSRQKADSGLTLESPEIRDRSTLSRLLPTTGFVAASLLLCYLYAQYWVPPRRNERLWKDLTLAQATVAGIAAVNVAVYVLWRYPPLWRLLTRYAYVVPATPRPISTIVSTFSHQTARHIASNMFLLFWFGTFLHAEVGRGVFVAGYMAAGIFGCWTSLANFTLRRIWTTSSLGASGGVAGVVGMYFTIHSDDAFTLWLIPKDWQDHLPRMPGWGMLGGIIAFEIWALFYSRWRNVDYIAHLGGYLAGIVSGWWWKESEKERKKNTGFKSFASGYRAEELNWYEKVLGKRPNS